MKRREEKDGDGEAGGVGSSESARSRWENQREALVLLAYNVHHTHFKKH